VEAVYQWDWPSAEKQFRRGIELKQEYAVGHHWYAINYLTPLGRFKEAQSSIQKALELEPSSLVMNSTMGLVYYFSRDYHKAIEKLEKTLQMDQDYPVTHFFLGRALVQVSRYSEAMEHFQKALKFYGDSTNMLATFAHAATRAGKEEITQKILNQLQEISENMYVSAYDMASIYVGLGQSDEALNWLQKAYNEHAYLMIYLKVDPLMDPLRPKKQFKKIIQKIHPS
jgi:serine/threonine-protein kinase